jgi:hypothetical protein
VQAEMEWNSIFVIQSLAQDEPKPARWLVHEDLYPASKYDHFNLMYVEVSGRRGFFGLMAEIERRCRNPRLRVRPILHFDAHASHSATGVHLEPSGETVTWEEFARCSRRINVASGNNLLVTTGFCHGIKAITKVDIALPTPFFAIVGPSDKPTAADVHSSFSAFYSELLHRGDISLGLTRMNAMFELYLCERVFLRTFAMHIRKHTRGKARQVWVEGLLTQFLQGYGARLLHISTARKVIKTLVRPNDRYFDFLKERFLLTNVHGNEVRFPCTLKEAVELADTL